MADLISCREILQLLYDWRHFLFLFFFLTYIFEDINFFYIYGDTTVYKIRIYKSALKSAYAAAYRICGMQWHSAYRMKTAFYNTGLETKFYIF